MRIHQEPWTDHPYTSFDLAPDGVYLAKRVTPPAGALLPHRFTLTCGSCLPIGGLFSAALSFGSPRLAVSQHPVLWSPDLPQSYDRGHPSDSPDAFNVIDHVGLVGRRTTIGCLARSSPSALSVLHAELCCVVVSDFSERGGWPSLLGRITSGEELGRNEAGEVMTEILEGRSTPVQIAALLASLKTRGEAVHEMAGFVDAMLAASLPLTLPAAAIDIVGTGGSPHRRRHALNVSTMACFVASAAGAVVCKHGNRKASSTSGSTDFLEALGVSFDLAPTELEKCVSSTGLGFAFARTYHPAMGHAGPVRAEMGIPTVFNMLGPMAHPGRVRRQLIGVSSQERAEQVAAVLTELTVDHVWVVVGDQGLDELSTSGPSSVWELKGGTVNQMPIDGTTYGLASATAEQVGGGDATENAAIFDRILAGEAGPHRDIIVLNAAAALVVAGVVDSVDSGVALAQAVLDDGRAAAKLVELKSFGN